MPDEINANTHGEKLAEQKRQIEQQKAQRVADMNSTTNGPLGTDWRGRGNGVMGGSKANG